MPINASTAVLLVLAPFALGACAHYPVATVLPRQEGRYEVIGQGAAEQHAYRRAQEEAEYTCHDQDRRLVVIDQQSIYQGANKDDRDDVEAENVALAFLTGHSGKERDADDYKVTLTIQCE